MIKLRNLESKIQVYKSVKFPGNSVRNLAVARTLKFPRIPDLEFPVALRVTLFNYFGLGPKIFGPSFGTLCWSNSVFSYSAVIATSTSTCC